MTQYLLDSTVHIHWIRGEQNIIHWFHEAVAAGHVLCTSAIAVAEIYSRAHPGELTAWNDYFHGLAVLDVGRQEALTAGRLRYDLARRGLQLHLADSLIAATALERQAPIVTANPRDFLITGADVLPLFP